MQEYLLFEGWRRRLSNIGALIIRMGFLGPLYYNHNKETPKNRIGNYLDPWSTRSAIVVASYVAAEDGIKWPVCASYIPGSLSEYSGYSTANPKTLQP